VPEDPPLANEVMKAREVVAQAISRCQHILGIAADVVMLPADLVQSADIRLSLSFLTPFDFAVVVVELCGEESTRALTDEQAASLTRRLLRLARRLEQSADQYVHKLLALLDLDPKPAAAVAPAPHRSPRSEPTLERLHGMPEAVDWGQQVA
jgi:hypothetical protein